jgi:50S ribosomal protein L16 3-hydroxylase
MNPPLGKLDSTVFLRDYWQKKPLLIRQAFPAFEPELDSNDIAGLACDELAEARLISGSYPEHDWKLEYGPFDEGRLRRLPDSRWTLLVQDVEKHYPPLRALVDAFDFLPRWRVDDLMVSVAAPGGSVGPHDDQYDVFLLQAEGHRSWEISENRDYDLLSGTDLNVFETFEPEQEWTLEPGDMLYLPPGVAHHGVALDRCMTWSIGMRAPSTADVLQAWGEWLATHRAEGDRYTDPDLAPGAGGAELDSESIGRFARLAAAGTGSSADFTRFLGSFLSRYRLAHEPLGPEEAVSEKHLAAALSDGAVLRQNPWTRLLWVAVDGGAMLFAAGSGYACSRAFAIMVCEPARLASEGLALADENPALLADLVNAGHLYVEMPS